MDCRFGADSNNFEAKWSHLGQLRSNGHLLICGPWIGEFPNLRAVGQGNADICNPFICSLQIKEIPLSVSLQMKEIRLSAVCR